MALWLWFQEMQGKLEKIREKLNSMIAK